MTKARLVLVHGRAQEGKSEEKLIDEWMRPLRAALGNRAVKLANVEVRAPFYGDELIRLARTLGDAPPDDIIVRGAPVAEGELPADYRAFLADTVERIRRAENIPDEEIVREADQAVIERGPQNWPWVLATMRLLNRIPGLDGDMIERFLRDTWIYLERRTVRKAINAIVAPAFDTDLPLIVVAHSLGSLVAYDLLRDRAAGPVPQLVTVGSPLGLDISRKAFSPIRHPATVGHWFNARDERDVVALYPLTTEYFNITPAITDHSAVRNRTPNAHGISGYLSDPKTIDVIAAALP